MAYLRRWSFVANEGTCALCACIWLCVGSLSSSIAIASPPVAERTVLDNKLTVATYRMPGARTAGIFGVVKVGSRHERPGQEGMAHFLEHMIFKGTPDRNNNKAVVGPIEGLGGRMNASTSFDRTLVNAAVPLLTDSETRRAHLGLGIGTVLDLMQNATLPERDLDIERGVVLAEIARSMTNQALAEYGCFWSSCGLRMHSVAAFLARSQ